jgi:hypothetical protein
MKTLAILVFAMLTIGAWAGPSSPGTFIPSITRQDLTGQGSFHRIGLIREQERAIAASERAATAAPREKSPSILERLCKSLFPNRKPEN